MNLLVCGTAEWHSSVCVYTDQWCFGNHSGTKEHEKQENGADFMANPHPRVRVMGHSHGSKTRPSSQEEKPKQLFQ